MTTSTDTLPPRILLKELADHWRVTTVTVRRWIAAGKIPPPPPGPGGKLSWPREVIRKFLDAGSREGTACA